MKLEHNIRIVIAAVALVASSICSADGKTQADERFDCLIVPNRVYDLGAEVQGVIDHIDVDAGDHVTKGQTLVVLKAELERAKLAQAISRLKMNSEISAREADLLLARQALSRLEKLHKKKLISEQEIEEAQTRLRVSDAALRNARDNRVMAQHDLMRYKVELNQRIIKSPIDGVVQRRHADAGELVTDSPVVTIAQINTLRVTVVLPADNISRFQVGGTATVYPELTDADPVTATVRSTDPVLDPASGTFGITLTLDNPTGSIIAGQECAVHFHSLAG